VVFLRQARTTQPTMHFDAVIRATQKGLERLQQLQAQIDSVSGSHTVQSKEKRLDIVWETRRQLDILALFKDSGGVSLTEHELELCGIVFDMEILARSVIRKALSERHAQEPTLYGRLLHPTLVEYLNGPHGCKDVPVCAGIDTQMRYDM
jgi:hypothetical protein